MLGRVMGAVLALAAAPAMAEKVSLVCLFDQKCQPNRECAEDTTRVDLRYDTKGGDAEVATEISRTKGTVHPGRAVISVIETLADGLVIVTSVQASDGRAVRTMHRTINGVVYPTQLLGYCRFPR